MSHIKFVLVIAIAALALSACQMSYPDSNVALTAAPTSVFSANQPQSTSSSDPMKDIETFATQTAIAKTAAAGGGQIATPTPLNGTPGAVNATNTPFIGATSSVPTSSTLAAVTPVSTAIPVSTANPATTPVNTPIVSTGRPASYTLQAGEFPYCIARRFNVDPDDLLALNGMGDGSVYMPGTVLKIPQTGSFPGARALRPHPTTYTVSSSDETLYSIACLFGDLDPAQIAQANGLALGSPLTFGQTLNIP